MQTWHIHIEGQVQGVGFRPFVYRLAKENKLNGWVCNTVDGVHVEINAKEEKAFIFFKKIIKSAPELSVISNHRIYLSEQQYFSDFKIIHSENNGEANLLLTPDFAICEDCRKELSSENNRRNNYPFITCTNCGPRFSITRKLPYDRETTTMEKFRQCPTCQKEYDNPLDRRYYSQTNSCPDCTIQLSLFGVAKNLTDSSFDKRIAELQFGVQPSKNVAKPAQRRTGVRRYVCTMDTIIEKWQNGKIVAIKGIGGYLLTCDAGNELAIKELRQRKHRPTKPFALMYPNLKILSEQVQLLADEKVALSSIEAPIVLLNYLSNAKSLLAVKAIAPDLDCLGVMLPYTPLYELLLNKFGKPIVATSGNVSNSSIVFQDEKAFSDLSKIADYILVNNRDIVVPQDDSVIKFSRRHRQKIVLRRSRGMAPSYVNPELKLPNKNILATGAMLKSTFTFLHQGNIFISQYLGDLESFDTQENFQHTVKHFFELFNARPKIILTDKHPEYFSTMYGEKLAQAFNAPIKKIQHHVAHFGAALGENNLMDSEESILGVIWDGTGLGDDGQIWGGEFFIYKNHEFSRCAHFDYFDFILGDKMSKEPRISALCTAWGVEGATEFLRPKFTPTEWQIYSKKLKKGSPLKTSSVGRMFDAVASLLGVLDKSNYEGEAAMLLEKLAADYFHKNSYDFSENYFNKKTNCQSISVVDLMSGIIGDIKKGKTKAFIAAKFHFSLVHLIKLIAKQLTIDNLAFSGGVFQNALLVDLIHEHMQNDFILYFHNNISPNDENISFGQLICHQIEQQRNQLKKQKGRPSLVGIF